MLLTRAETGGEESRRRANPTSELTLVHLARRRRGLPRRGAYRRLEAGAQREGPALPSTHETFSSDGLVRRRALLRLSYWHTVSPPLP